VLRELDLPAHGLRWSRPERVVTHVGDPADTTGALLHLDRAVTAELLEQDHPGDGAAWLELVALWHRVREPLLDALLARWPPVRAAGRLVGAVGARQTLDLVRTLVLPLTRFAEERFEGERARALLAGNSAHADIPPEAPGSGLFGFLMAMLAQDVGFPSPTGGAGGLAEALARRAEAAGAQLRTGDPVCRVVTAGGRAVGVETQGGARIRARRAVVADTSAPSLYRELLAPDAVPAGLLAELDRFAWDLPTVKVNLRLLDGAAGSGHGRRARGAGLRRPGPVGCRPRLRCAAE
jgi:phytoene dehydrogenase-like protein